MNVAETVKRMHNHNLYSLSRISELSDDDGLMAGHCHPGERCSHGQPAGSHDY